MDRIGIGVIGSVQVASPLYGDEMPLVDPKNIPICLSTRTWVLAINPEHLQKMRMASSEMEGQESRGQGSEMGL